MDREAWAAQVLRAGASRRNLALVPGAASREARPLETPQARGSCNEVDWPVRFSLR